MGKAPNPALGLTFRSPRNPWAVLRAGFLAVALLSVAGLPVAAQTVGQVVKVVAAENFYGDVVSQIGGSHVQVLSILSDPNVDPHLYESSVDDAKAIASADIVVKNSVGYDAFIDKLLAASPRPDRILIDVGALTGHKNGDNPHIWYDPATMPAVAQTVTQALSQKDPADQAYFVAQSQTFVSSLQPIQAQLAALQAKYGGTRILATEPIFNYTARAAGIVVLDAEGEFQKATQDGNDPPAFAVVKFRNQLMGGAARALIFNVQAVTNMSQQMQALAQQNNVPVVAASETQPPNTTYQQWQLSQLQNLMQALGG
jgi:zinc/manganese transport system substrate-binding protein